MKSHEEKLAARRDHYAKNRENIKARKRELWALKPKEDRKKYSRNQNLKNAYGITQTAFEEKLSGQNGVCAICGRKSAFKNRPLMVDHDHEYGVIRGLLCGHCNLVIGHCFDSKVILKRAIDYLEKWQQTPPDGYDDERNHGKEAA